MVRSIEPVHFPEVDLTVTCWRNPDDSRLDRFFLAEIGLLPGYGLMNDGFALYLIRLTR